MMCGSTSSWNMIVPFIYTFFYSIADSIIFKLKLFKLLNWNKDDSKLETDTVWLVRRCTGRLSLRFWLELRYNGS